jgi:uncharacterized protein
MNPLFLLAYIALGIFAGVLGGVLGIGGGIIIIPILVFVFGLSQHLAQGTTLALLVPPIGILAAITYYKQGFVDVKIAGLIAVGFVIGGFFGAKIATQLPTDILAKIFGITLILVGVKYLLTKK